MKPAPPFAFVSLLLAGLLAAGCGSIARTAPKDPVQIEIGKTTKRDVIDLIGLPNLNERHEIEGRVTENWIYLKKADLSVVMIVGPPILKNRTKIPRRDIALIVTFVGSAVVADVADLRETP